MNAQQRQRNFRAGANDVVRHMVARVGSVEAQLEQCRQRGDDPEEYERSLAELRDTLRAMLELRRK